MRTSWPALFLLAGANLMTGATTHTEAEFGKLPDGSVAYIFTLANRNRVEARITNYGGRIVSLSVPDRAGKFADVVLGFDSLAEYLSNGSTFFGALIGRYANRIGGARFTLDGVAYQLEKNDGGNSLHGGSHGFDKRLWTPRLLPDGGLELTYHSKDGEEGFPGNLTAIVTYHLNDANEIRIDYRAVSDKDTVVNLTNHSYFNLKGAGAGDILGHVLTIRASRFTPVDSGLIPSGELRSVAGTAFDFRTPIAIGARIGQNDEQLQRGRGYDHNYALDKPGNGLQLAARVEEPESGRVLEVSTTEPGVQFYTGNFLDGTVRGKGGKLYPHRGAFCLETQHFPDSPNKPEFPPVVLHPGQHFEETTVFRFLVAH